jgi:hypothetical protein
MSSVISTVTLSEICFPDIAGKTIRAWGQVNFTPGTYLQGGLPMGLLQFADGRTIDFNGFLRCKVWGEEPITATVGNYMYHYSPVNDALQIFQNNAGTGVELANGAQVPVQVLNDIVLFLATWNRTTVLG